MSKFKKTRTANIRKYWKPILAAVAAVVAVLIFWAPSASAYPGDYTGWYGRNCTGTYDNTYNVNINVYWGTNNDRRVWVSGSEHDPVLGYEGMDQIDIYAAAVGGTWVLKGTIQPGPGYGDIDYILVPYYHLGNPYVPIQWIAKERWAGDWCVTPKVYN